MATMSASLISPATREENNAAYTIKQWCAYNTGMNNIYNLANLDDVEKAFNSLVQWVIAAGEQPLVKTAEDAIMYLIHTHGIGDVQSMHDAFDRPYWGLLAGHGFNLPFSIIVNNEHLYAPQHRMIRYQAPKLVKPASECNQADTNPIPAPIKMEMPEITYTGEKVKHPNQTGRDRWGWRSHDIPAGIAPDMRRNGDNWNVCYDATGVSLPLMYPAEESLRGTSTQSSFNKGNTYNNAIRHQYMEDSKTEDIQDVRMVSLRLWIKRGGKPCVHTVRHGKKKSA